MTPWDELMAALGDVRCVFWTCPNTEHRFVTWTTADDKMTPRCDTCGTTGAPR